MEWNKRLGLSASLLAGGTDELPQLFPGPGQTEENRDLTALICFQRHLPITGWRASPVFKVQCRVPRPDYQDLILRTSLYFWKTRRKKFKTHKSCLGYLGLAYQFIAVDYFK